jgi:hypothetical protein
MALVWGGAACYNGHRVGGDFSVIGFMAQLATKKINNAKAWTSDEDGDFGSSSSPMSRPLTPPQT